MMRRCSDYSYDTSKKLGSGAFGNVYQGSHVTQGTLVAVKEIEHLRMGQAEQRYLRQEIQVMRGLPEHPNILKLLSAEQSERTCLVLDLCPNGDLYHFMRDSNRVQHPLEEDLARDFMCQISLGLKFLHENNIIHRDLKPANILMKGNVLKISDFGFAKKLNNPNELLTSALGTALYMGPEVYTRCYTSKSDIWSAGIIFYEMLTGAHPITSCHPTPIVDKFQLRTAVTDESLAINYPSHITPLCIDLLKNMLQKSHTKRYGWEQFFSHKYLAPKNLAQSTVMLFDPKKKSEMISMSNLWATRLKDQQAIIFTVTILSSKIHGERVQIPVLSSETLWSLKQSIDPKFGIPYAEQVLLDQNGILLDDYKIIDDYRKSSFYIVALEVFRFQSMPPVSVPYKPKNIPLECIEQITTGQQDAQYDFILQKLYTVIKMRIDSVNCAIAEYQTHVDAFSIVQRYSFSDLADLRESFERMESLRKAQQSELNDIKERSTEAKAQLQSTPLDPATCGPGSKKLIDLVEPADLRLLDELPKLSDNLNSLFHEISRKIGGFDKDFLAVAKERDIRKNQFSRIKEGLAREYQSLKQKLDRLVYVTDKQSFCQEQCFPIDESTSLLMKQCINLKREASAEIAAMSPISKETVELFQLTKPLLVNLEKQLDKFQNNLMTCQAIINIPSHYAEGLRENQRRRRFKEETTKLTEVYNSAFVTVCGMITATTVPPNQILNQKVPELYHQWVPPVVKPIVSPEVRYPNTVQVPDIDEPASGGTWFAPVKWIFGDQKGSLESQRKTNQELLEGINNLVTSMHDDAASVVSLSASSLTHSLLIQIRPLEEQLKKTVEEINQRVSQGSGEERRLKALLVKESQVAKEFAAQRQSYRPQDISQISQQIASLERQLQYANVCLERLDVLNHK